MRPASSKPYSGMPLAALDEELTSQVKKLTLLEGDRAEFKRQAEDTQAKNNEWIEKLRQENRKLKQIRDDLISQRRQPFTSDQSMTAGSNRPDPRSETFWRRKLDEQKHTTKALRNRLHTMQDKLKDVDSNKISYIEESPLMREIRILEGRLDKVMIKYNEANSLRETYEQVVKRLKEERVGYDNQITAIQRSLKGKECDFEELLLLAHDASHAREVAQAELKKYEHKRSAIKDLREQYLTQKKNDVEQIRLGINQEQTQQPYRHFKLQEVAAPEGQDPSSELEDFAEAFKKLKEVTGVSDANEIIHKFKTQGMTSKSLEELRDKYRMKIEELRNERELAKEQLNRIKYEGGSGIATNKRKLDDVEANLNRMQSQTERMRVKWEKLSKTLVNVKVAVEHLSSYLVAVKAGRPSSSIDSQNQAIDFNALLESTNEKLRVAFNIVKNDPHFSSEKFKQSTAGIERFINKGGDGDAAAKTRPPSNLHKDDSSGNEFDEEMDEEANDKIKQRFQQTRIEKQPVLRNFRKYKA